MASYCALILTSLIDLRMSSVLRYSSMSAASTLLSYLIKDSRLLSGKSCSIYYLIRSALVGDFALVAPKVIVLRGLLFVALLLIIFARFYFAILNLV